MCSAKIKQTDTFSGVYEIEIYKTSYLSSNRNYYLNNMSPQIALNQQIHFSQYSVKKEPPYKGRFHTIRGLRLSD